MNEPESITVDRAEWEHLRRELEEKEAMLCRARGLVNHYIDMGRRSVFTDRLADALSSSSPCPHAKAVEWACSIGAAGMLEEKPIEEFQAELYRRAGGGE